MILIIQWYDVMMLIISVYVSINNASVFLVIFIDSVCATCECFNKLTYLLTMWHDDTFLWHCVSVGLNKVQWGQHKFWSNFGEARSSITHFICLLLLGNAGCGGHAEGGLSIGFSSWRSVGWRRNSPDAHLWPQHHLRQVLPDAAALAVRLRWGRSVGP